MTKSATVQARIEPALKADAEAVLSALGINATTAITLLYTQIVRHRGLPLELRVPNEDVVAAMRQLRDPEWRAAAPVFDSVDDLLTDLAS